ncbi:MAG: hypothetical protein U0640_13220 [Phycisphaerales bacterium]
MVNFKWMASAVAAGFFACAADAATVRVFVEGRIESNAFTSGTFAGQPVGAPVEMTITLDSNNYLDSPNLPGRTRGYRFTPGTFSLRVGSVTTTLRNNVTSAYFVVRNNDPRVDGFFLSVGTDIDTPIPLAMTPNNYGIAFSRTFGNIPPFPDPDPTLQSLDILGAIGTWGFDNISSYNFAVQLGEISVPLVFEYQRITISRVTECDSIDFNNDTSLFDPQDIEAFLSVYSEGACVPANATCNDIDFNNDTSVFDPCDINSFLVMYSEGPCTACGG